MLILETHGTFDFPGGGADPISPSGSAHWPFKRVWMGGGSAGIHYSLKFSPLFISLKFWVIH